MLRIRRRFQRKRCILCGPMCTGKRQTHIRNAPSSRTAVTCIDPYNAYKNSVGTSELFQSSREKSRKTEAVFWPVQGGPEGNRNPSGLVFFSQSFLLEKQKKRRKGSRKFLRCVSTLQNVSLTAKYYGSQMRLNGMERYRQACRMHRIICAWLHSSSAIFSSIQRCVPAFSASASYASCAACSSV